MKQTGSRTQVEIGGYVGSQMGNQLPTSKSDELVHYRAPEAFCISCDWVGPIHLMTLDHGGYVCEECEIERSMKIELRGATFKQSITALPAGAPAMAILIGALWYGVNVELFALGIVAGGLAILHALYSLQAFRAQELLPLRDQLSVSERYEPVGVAGAMAVIGTLSGGINLLGFFL